VLHKLKELTDQYICICICACTNAQSFHNGPTLTCTHVNGRRRQPAAVALLGNQASSRSADIRRQPACWIAAHTNTARLALIEITLFYYVSETILKASLFRIAVQRRWARAKKRRSRCEHWKKRKLTWPDRSPHSSGSDPFQSTVAPGHRVRMHSSIGLTRRFSEVSCSTGTAGSGSTVRRYTSSWRPSSS